MHLTGFTIKIAIIRNGNCPNPDLEFEINMIQNQIKGKIIIEEDEDNDALSDIEIDEPEPEIARKGLRSNTELPLAN